MMRCEHCGHEQEGGKFCETCGRMLTRIIVAAAAEPAVEKSNSVALLRCAACGNEQQTGKFCERCGIRLDIYRRSPPEPEPAKCPECGLLTSRQICPSCGTRIYRPEES